MTVATQKTRKKRSTAAEKRIAESWKQLPLTYNESPLTAFFILRLFQEIGVGQHQIKDQENVGKDGIILRPDILVYGDLDSPPSLVVEVKRREAKLAEFEGDDFPDFCKENKLYRDAVGLTEGENGILQYLDNSKVDPKYLANYGLVINGDFFQLWRRVDGLVFPITEIQRITEQSLVSICRQIKHCLSNKPSGVVAAVWNRKGGVAKTTNTINIASTLALHGKKVLFVDLDPQNDLTRGLGFKIDKNEEFNKSVYPGQVINKLVLDEYEAVNSLLDQAIQENSYSTSDNQKFSLSILTANRELLNKLRKGNDFIGIYEDKIFKELFSLLIQRYDYVFVDVHPVVDRLTQGLFRVCDVMLLPVEIDEKSTYHAIHLNSKVLPRIRKKRVASDRLFIGPWSLGVVFSNCSYSKIGAVDRVIEKRLVDYGFDQEQVSKRLENSLKRYNQVRVAEIKRMPVVCWRDSPITKCYEKLTQEIFLQPNFTAQ